MKKNVTISPTVKVMLFIIAITLFVVAVIKIKKQQGLGAVSKKKISQKKCKEAFGMLEQIHSALTDKENRLSIVETGWYASIGKLLNK